MTPFDLPVTIVDAFTREPGAGNRAGVVLDAQALDRDDMQAAARAVAAAETAFLLPGERGADFSLRFFSPATEIDFCGHDTVATFHLLAEDGRISVPGRFAFDCPAGRVEVEVEPVGDHFRTWIATPRRPWEDSPIPVASLLPLLGTRTIAPGLPIRKTGSKLFVPIASRNDLWALSPRWDELMALGLAHDIQGFYAFTLEAADPRHVAQGRFFAPAVGVREDPVTGSANGALAEYLAIHGVLALPAGGGTVRARAEQGDAMGKPGRVDLEASGRPGAVERVRVGGVAVTVLSGALRMERAAPAAAGMES